LDTATHNNSNYISQHVFVFCPIETLKLKKLCMNMIECDREKFWFARNLRSC